MSNCRVGSERGIRLSIEMNRSAAKATIRANRCLFKRPKTQDRDASALEKPPMDSVHTAKSLES